MSASQRITDLTTWATSHGASLNSLVEVYDDAQTGFSFRVREGAQSSLQPLDPVVRLPVGLSLSYINALPGRNEHDLKPFPDAFMAMAPPHIVSRFLLMKHFVLGDQSFWAPYVRSLTPPSDEDTWALPPFWPSDEAELLEGTNIEVGVSKIRSDVRREYSEARDILEDAAYDPEILKGFSLNLYQWAYCVFSSRSFRPSLVLGPEDREALPAGIDLDSFSVLLPLFDIGNHDMTTEVQWELTDGGCELKVNKTYQPGEQVYNNYSMKTNAELLLGYGFMIPETEELHNDYVHVRKRQDATPAAVAAEEYYISLRPIRHPSTLLARARQPFQLPPSVPILKAFEHVQHNMVWDIFCTLAPPEQHAQLIPVDEALQGQEADQARCESFFAGKVSKEGRVYLQQTAGIIQHKVFQELERLDETDVEMHGEGDLVRNQKLALNYRARCRRVLESTLEAMEMDELLRGAE